MNYDKAALAVTNLIVVPKHFFIPEIIEPANRWLSLRGAQVGRGVTFCLATCRMQEKSGLFGMGAMSSR